MQAEPSPTTGSFFKPQLMQASGDNVAVLLERSFTSGNTVDEKSSSGFEFRFHTGVSTTSGFSSAGMSVMSFSFFFGFKTVTIFHTVPKIRCMKSNAKLICKICVTRLALRYLSSQE